MEQNTSTRQKTVLIIVAAMIVLCLTAAISAVIGGAAGYLIAQRGREPGVIMRPNPPMPAPLRPFQPEIPDQRQPQQPGIPDDRLPLAPGAIDRPGAFVRSVAPDGPAGKAGVRVGDLITALDDKQISEDLTLADALAAYEPGDEVTLTVYRGGEQKITVTLGAHPDDAARPYLGISFVTIPTP